MLNNVALQGGVSTITAAGNTTLGFAPGNTSPKSLVIVSAASAATIILPVINLTGTTLGIGDAQVVRVMNLAAQAVAIGVNSADSSVGASGTIAQNAQAILTSNATNSTWYRV